MYTWVVNDIYKRIIVLSLNYWILIKHAAAYAYHIPTNYLNKMEKMPVIILEKMHKFLSTQSTLAYVNSVIKCLVMYVEYMICVLHHILRQYKYLYDFNHTVIDE